MLFLIHKPFESKPVEVSIACSNCAYGKVKKICLEFSHKSQNVSSAQVLGFFLKVKMLCQEILSSQSGPGELWRSLLDIEGKLLLNF